MTAFTLGVHNLPAAEVVLIKTLMRLFPATASFKWRYAETGPFDAVVTDATTASSEVPAGLARGVLKITRADAAGDADCITRPIRAEQLQAWLARQSEFLQLLPRLPARAEARAATQAGDTRYKLRRWPSAALLQNDPQRIRLATLLSRRALGAQELARISRLPAEQCQAFVDSLQRTGLIEVVRAETAAATRKPAASAPGLPRPLAGGLIDGIRRRFGL